MHYINNVYILNILFLKSFKALGQAFIKHEECYCIIQTISIGLDNFVVRPIKIVFMHVVSCYLSCENYDSVEQWQVWQILTADLSVSFVSRSA